MGKGVYLPKREGDVWTVKDGVKGGVKIMERNMMGKERRKIRGWGVRPWMALKVRIGSLCWVWDRAEL